MKPTTSAVFLVLALSLLVSAPFTAEAKKKKPAESFAAAAKAGEAAETKKIKNTFCSLSCEGKKGKDLEICVESCDLSQRSNLVQYGRIQCKGKCTEQKGITKPAMEVCQQKCDKEYVVKAAEVIAACSATCAKEKNPSLSQQCKNKCTPPAS